MTNGLLTRIYDWDQEEAILSLHFRDFVDGNKNYKNLVDLLAAAVVSKGWADGQTRLTGHRLSRPSTEVVKTAFARCHKIIWKAEKMSPQAAFFEFAKLLFVKMMEDKRIKGNSELYGLVLEGKPLPVDCVCFSTSWIDSQENQGFENPVNTTLFVNLRNKLEAQIGLGKKRIFEKDDSLRMSSGTAKRVVSVLENFFLFGIDEDLNGRMFETFLSATMRGQELGQYFSPRSVTKLMTKMAI